MLKHMLKHTMAFLFPLVVPCSTVNPGNNNLEKFDIREGPSLGICHKKILSEMISGILAGMRNISVIAPKINFYF